MQPEVIVICENLLPSASSWQAVIEREGLAVALGPQGGHGARLAGTEASFLVEEIGLAQVPNLHLRPGAWRHALAFAGTGSEASSLAARAGALAYMLGTGGGLADPITGPLDPKAFMGWALEVGSRLAAALPKTQTGSSSPVMQAVRH